jgi:hypothetical protein
MAGWSELRGDLRRLESLDPSPLMSFPDPDSEAREERPISIELAAWATGLAAELHERYGDLVSLVVGVMEYPACRRRLGSGPPALGEPWTGLDLELTEPLALRSGHSATVPLRVVNEEPVARELSTSGQLHTLVVDRSGRAVGGYVGAVTAMLRIYTVEPDGALDVPALVGTASLVEDLGYAVPPGEWHLVAMQGGRVSNPLPLTVTA